MVNNCQLTSVVLKWITLNARRNSSNLTILPNLNLELGQIFGWHHSSERGSHMVHTCQVLYKLVTH